MRTALLLVVALALVLSASAVWAIPSGINRGTQSWLTTYSEANGGPGTWSGIYNGVGDGKGWYNEIVGGNSANLTVAADVELFCSQTWENTGVYFHKADATNPPPVVLPGTMTSNHGEWIGLVADKVGAGIFNLDRKYNYRLDLVEKGDFNIPLVWEMRDSVAQGWSPWKAPEAIDTAGADGTIPTAVWWLLGNNTPGSSAGQAGAYQYEFQCTAQMSELQQDGRYELDPAVVVSPEL